MEFTGERVIPGEGDIDLLNEHRARYLFARQFSEGRQVLDAACGTGYGSALLAENAGAVFGTDIAPEALAYAREHFRSPNVHFVQSDCLALPFPAERFDLVVAFEIIEHLKNAAGFLAELRRVLHPAGQLLLSTPNRLYYTEERGETNPFHEREFSYPELEEILRPFFPHRSIFLENHIPGLLLCGETKPNFGGHPAPSIVLDEYRSPALEERQRTAHFLLAICSAQPLGLVPPLLLLPSLGNVLREREMYIERLRQRLSEKDAYVLQLQADYDSKVQWALSLERELEQARAKLQRLQDDYERDLEEARAKLQDLQADYERKIQWALGLEQDLEKARAALQQLQQEFEERTAWALQMDAELKDRKADLRLLYSSRWYRLGKKLKFLRLSPAPPSDQGSSERNPQ